MGVANNNAVDCGKCIAPENVLLSPLQGRNDVMNTFPKKLFFSFSQVRR